MKLPFIFLLVGITACVPDMKERGYDTKKLAQEIKDRKIKKLSPTQINAWVYEKGNLITQTLNQAYGTIDFSRQEITLLGSYRGLSNIDSLEKAYNVDIEALEIADTDSWKNYSKKSKEVLDAYLYQAQNSQNIQPNLQKLEDDKFLFTGPAHSNKIIWVVFFTKKEVIRKIDQKEFNP
ncbi:MAG: hypothetical protein MUC49_08540 [Raineya sp.]|jgi:hypothetical protein|nr:hypothetical protein [Raineya sp.]